MHWLDHVFSRHISRSSSCVGGIRAVITSAALVEPVPGRADGVGFIIIFVCCGAVRGGPGEGGGSLSSREREREREREI
eukprot:scaffold501_cov145-Skeletonema_menzelii.AAC.9